MYEGVIILKDGGKRPFIVETMEEVTAILTQYWGSISRVTFKKIKGEDK